MNGRRLLIVLILLSALFPSAAPAAQGSVLARALVPKEKSPHGEVRLLIRDDSLLLQTLLHSKILKRVLGAIARKEKTFWKGKPEEVDSQLYLAALSKSYDEVWEQFRAREDRDDRYQELLITFGIQQQDAWIEIARPEFAGEIGNFDILEQKPLQRLEPTRGYMLGSLFEISRDALGLTDAELLNRVKNAEPKFDWLSNE